MFNRGLVQQAGPPLELQTAPATPFVMSFVTDINALPSSHAVGDHVIDANL